MPDGKENKKTVVVIDVGHGLVPYGQKLVPNKNGKPHSFKKINNDGWDEGAARDSKDEYGNECYVPEFDINIQNAELLREELEARGYEVILTTDERVEKPVKGDNFNSRFRVAHEHDADIYISMHANSSPSEEMKGTWIYTAPEKTYRNRHHRKVKSEETIITTELASDIIDGLYPVKHTPALDEERLHVLSEGHRGPLKGLNNHETKKIPGILIEAGFLSNEDDRRNLQDPSYCGKMVSAIADGIDKYCSAHSLLHEAKQAVAEMDIIPQKMDSIKTTLETYSVAIKTPLPAHK